MNGYRIEVVSCLPQGDKLTCKLRFTNLRGHDGRRLAVRGPTTATLDDNTLLRAAGGGRRGGVGGLVFDGEEGIKLLQPGVSMDGDRPREMIITFADVPKSAKKITVLNFGFDPPNHDVKMPDIEIQRQTGSP
jgi:hypothetical protein